eukprot:m.54174 g.54174  ORF g.54174 m.54174 type:complete len:496 (-) comp6561_c0_seq1:116-1603(-)
MWGWSRTQHFMIPPEDEDLNALLSAAVARPQLLMYHAPRQSGKTTRLLALCNRLGQQGHACRSFSLETVARTPFADFKDRLTLRESEAALLIDEFDLVTSHPDRDEILRFLRSQRHWTGKACICIGTFEIFVADVTPAANGPPFNGKNGVAASTFSRDQVMRLIDEFAVEYEVEVDMEVVEDISAVTGGHRGLVTTAGSCLELIVFKYAGIKHIGLAEWFSCEADFANKIIVSPAFTRTAHRARLEGYSARDIYSIFACIDRVSLCTIGGDAEQLRLVVLLSEIGVLLPANEGQSFRMGPPVLQQLAHALIPEKRVHPPHDLDFDSQPSILRVLMAEALPLALYLRDAGARKMRLCPTWRGLPSEEAYCLAFAHMWAKYLDPATLRRQAQADDAKQPVDYVALFPGCKQPSVIRFVAHSCPGPGPAPGHSTVAEFLHRVDARYQKIVGQSGSLWVINVALKDMRSKFLELSHPRVRILHVFHSDEDPKDVEFIEK